ncbi:hypothetical protein D6D28_05465 [Aureobasidium pullulans]|uniref:Uncharacterized protein n=1 Tax=Aureobasidium pullulans TaxID=5580 RepID=A0A4S8SH90_AURPU|nr:hypothetical protein D6D28_05465 [Aureobasidium pullulans]THW83951.1 hypothetical protein D6D15_09222 [Aureobasidium pullulans]
MYVYGPEGRLDVRYVANTKDALKDIASVTDQLHRSFDIMHDAGRQSFSRDNLVNVATKA